MSRTWVTQSSVVWEWRSASREPAGVWGQKLGINRWDNEDIFPFTFLFTVSYFIHTEKKKKQCKKCDVLNPSMFPY